MFNEIQYAPRTATLYVRISKVSRAFVRDFTKRVRKETKGKVSESEVVDKLLLTLAAKSKKRRAAQTVRKAKKATKKAA